MIEKEGERFALFSVVNGKEEREYKGIGSCDKSLHDYH